MSTLTTIVTPKQWEVLLLAGLEVPAVVIHGGYRRIEWPVKDTPKMYWTLEKIIPRHAARAIPYRKLQLSLFKSLRHWRATTP